ncbi:hypothetical protein [Paenibacillus whitsoniae]|uniref:Uncharacterized protein n=1 Tax=Paenibacillus whitsoniae TaxID=2496558 RepID=A0A3S0C5M3_9BACL|nr:hypothetical protein [Paenibacillus whitsoniae]RTE04273.1 hypothetical protein EJQ19_27010 [Paenibacillus whitsoniae]
MLLLIIGYAVIVSYQLVLMKRHSVEAKERKVAFSVTSVSFLLGMLCIVRPNWVNPDKAIRFFFEPLQHFMMGS